MATEVNFYHLTKSSLEDALPRLLVKTLQAGERAVVMLGSPERVDALNTHLWAYDQDSFLPHGSARDGEADRQPVWLTHLDENPNGAAFLFVADRARSDRLADYKRCFELFDGRDDTAVADSRERWKAYKAAGHTLAYWQQTAYRRLGEEGVASRSFLPARSRGGAPYVTEGSGPQHVVAHDPSVAIRAPARAWRGEEMIQRRGNLNAAHAAASRSPNV